MKSLLLALALITVPAWAQDKALKKKTAAAKAHAKPTPEQIRRFNDLQKKRKATDKSIPSDG